MGDFSKNKPMEQTFVCGIILPDLRLVPLDLAPVSAPKAVAAR